MSLFDDDIDFQVDEKKVKPSVIKREAKKKAALIRRGEELRSILPTLEKGYDYHLVSNDNFGQIELLMFLFDQFDITDVDITTWSYNSSFVNLIEEKCKNTKFRICVDQSMGQRKHALFNQIKTLSVEGIIQFKQHHGLHSKVTIGRGKGIYFAIESSANYSLNKRIEQFNISTTKELYDFHKKWIDKIFQ